MKWTYLLTFLIAACYSPVVSASLSRSNSPISSTVSLSSTLKSMNTANMVAEDNKHVEGGFQIPKGLKLLIGAGGIYASFLYYGALQEDVFHFKAADGTMFKQAWFLQALGKSHTCLSSFLVSLLLTLVTCIFA